jgi:pimeloyl-ACP methyl ester carboxylesterase
MVQAGYRCLSIDLPGHGDSGKPSEPQFYQIDTFYAQFAEWYQQELGNEPSVLVSHSMGGFISLLQALKQPETVKALVLINPLFSPEQLHPVTGFLRRYPQVGSRAMAFIPDWLLYALSALDPAGGRQFSGDERKRLVMDYKRTSPKILYLTNTIYDLLPRVPSIGHPALVLWGEQDRTLAPESFPRLLKSLPQGRGYRIHGAGHQPHLSHTDEVQATILRFLELIDIAQPRPLSNP